MAFLAHVSCSHNEILVAVGLLGFSEFHVRLKVPEVEELRFFIFKVNCSLL